MASNKFVEVNIDAWSDGQTQSKIWLCRELEKNWKKKAPHIWIYGSWYGLLANLIIQREKIEISQFQLFDIDNDALEFSKAINHTWSISKKIEFSYHHQDCNLISIEQIENQKPDLVINTSCEHFKNYKWFQNLPKGQKFAIQSCDLDHHTHVLKSSSLEQFQNSLGKVSEIIFSGSLRFNYPINSYTRFMIIGKK